MTLGEWTLARQQGPRLECTQEEREQVVTQLLDSALTARRAGVVPTLADLAESEEACAAWTAAAEIYRQEKQWHALGAGPGRPPLLIAHENRHKQLLAKFVAQRAG